MRKPVVQSLIAGLLLLVISSCSASSSTAVSAPSITVPEKNASISGTAVWGFYDIHFDSDTGAFDVLRNRSGEFTMNVVKFLNMNPPCLLIKINSKTPGSGFVDIDLDITIKHPLNDAKFDAYDVRGVLLGEDGYFLHYNNDLTYTDPGFNQVLLNPDGYTRWYNPTEFTTSGLFGYVKGIYAPNGPAGNATLNAYKYFGEGLGATDDLWGYLQSKSMNVGYFLHNSSNTRNYKIRFHHPENGIKFGYSVLATWSGGAPEFHPSHAVEAVAVSVIDQSDLYYKSPSDSGGNLVLDISIFDWFSELDGGVMKNYNLFIESKVHAGVYELSDLEMTPVESGIHWNKYHVEIPGDNIDNPGAFDAWIIVEYPGSDYSNPLGVPNAAAGDPLASFFRLRPTVEDLSEESGWAVTWGTEYGDTYNGVAIDQQSNIYVTGALGTQSHPNPTSQIIVNKHASNGDLAWTRSWGNPTGYSGGGQVAVDASGNTYSTGYFSGENIDFDPGPGEDLHSAFYPGGSDIYLTSFDPDGNFRWARTWGGYNDEDCGWDVAVDNAGWVYVSGVFNSDSIDFDPGNGTDIHMNNGGIDGFLSKFDLSGNFQWAVTLGGESNDWIWGMTVDPSGHVATAGFFEGAVDFDPGPGEDWHSTDWVDGFLSKFGPDGSFEWCKSWGPAGGAQASNVAADQLGNFYVSGAFLGIGVDFDPGTGTDLHDSVSQTVADACLSKFDSSGNFVWAKTWGGADEVWGDNAAQVAVDGLEAVYVLGGFYGPDVDFDPGDGVDLQSSSGINGFLTRFDLDGNWNWTRIWATDSYTFGRGLGVSPTGSVCVSGEFEGTDSDFAPTGPPCNEESDLHTNLGGSNNGDGFLVKYMPDGCW